MKHILLLTMVVGAAGCAAPSARDTVGQPALRALGQSVTVEEDRSDESIGAEIRRRFEIADAAGTAGVIIEVDGGVVTLRGSTAGLNSAWSAEALAHAVPGVKEVRNQILTRQTGAQ